MVSLMNSRETAIRGQWKRLRQGDTLATVAEGLTPNLRRSLAMCREIGTFDAGLDFAAKADQRPGSKHPNRWTTTGTLKLAFSQVGGAGGQHKRETHNEIAATSTVALASTHHSQEHLKAFSAVVEAAPRDQRPAWCIVERHWDLTPLNVNFGLVGDLLRPLAKYWVSEPDGGEAAKTSTRGRGKKTRILLCTFGSCLGGSLSPSGCKVSIQSDGIPGILGLFDEL